jgi:hypothetical protein
MVVIMRVLLEALKDVEWFEWAATFVIAVALAATLARCKHQWLVAIKAQEVKAQEVKLREVQAQEVTRELEVGPPVSAKTAPGPAVEESSWIGCKPWLQSYASGTCLAGCCGAPPPRKPKFRAPVARPAPSLAGKDLDSVRQSLTEYRGHSKVDQLEALDQFMAAVQTTQDLVMPDELMALRFVRARRLDVYKALEMYKTHMEYKLGACKEALAQRLDAADAAKLSKVYPSRMIGRCKAGRPVKVFKVGALDLGRCGFSADDMVREHIRSMEKFADSLSWRDFSKPPPDALATTSSPLEGGLVIVDLEGCSWDKFWAATSYWSQVASIDQANYPEMLSKQVIINPVFGFDVGWRFAKSILDEHTISKVEIIWGDARPRLAELIDQAVCPEEYRL